MNCIKTIRAIERDAKLWELKTTEDLSQQEGNEAYLRALEGKKYLIYLPAGGKVMLNLINEGNAYVLKWISTDDAKWSEETTIMGGDMVELDAQCKRSCFGLLILKSTYE